MQQLNLSFFKFVFEQLKTLRLLTRHSTQMPQNGSRVIREDSEVPSMSEERIKRQGYFYIFPKEYQRIPRQEAQGHLHGHS